ncbi:hypothetical protein Hanom_Chr01g00030191 [Helianthus anomalus]
MKMSINLDVNSMASRHVSFLNLEFDVFIFLNLISFFLNLISGTQRWQRSLPYV